MNYFWSFLLNIFRPRLTVGKWNWIGSRGWGMGGTTEPLFSSHLEQSPAPSSLAWLPWHCATWKLLLPSGSSFLCCRLSHSQTEHLVPSVLFDDSSLTISPIPRATGPACPLQFLFNALLQLPSPMINPRVRYPGACWVHLNGRPICTCFSSIRAKPNPLPHKPPLCRPPLR